MKKILIAGMAAILLASCANKEKRESNYEKWVGTLGDSIKNTEETIRLTEDSVRILHDSIGAMLREFSYVDNPRQVEGYTILTSWRGRYPLSTTGLVARITKSEAFELIGTLRGGNFNRIEVSAGGESAVSETVAFDQALNYREGGLNTVAFSGSAADSIGELISDNAGGGITVRYIPLGKTITLSPDAARMIAQTWQLYSAQRKVQHMERLMPLMHKKIDAYRRIKDSNAK